MSTEVEKGVWGEDEHHFLSSLRNIQVGREEIRQHKPTNRGSSKLERSEEAVGCSCRSRFDSYGLRQKGRQSAAGGLLEMVDMVRDKPTRVEARSGKKNKRRCERGGGREGD